MVDLRPRPGAELPAGASPANWVGKDLTLLVIERPTAPGADRYDEQGFPVHDLDVRVAMYEGANPGLRRQGDDRLAKAPVDYDYQQFMEVVTAAWQQDDPADTAPVPVVADRTEQNVAGKGDTLSGTVYVVRADVAAAPGISPHIVAGTVRRADPQTVPGFVMEAQSRACAQASVAASKSRLAELTSGFPEELQSGDEGLQH